MACEGSGFGHALAHRARACGKITFLRILVAGHVTYEAHTQLRMAASMTIGLRWLAGAYCAYHLPHARETSSDGDDRVEAFECSGIGKCERTELLEILQASQEIIGRALRLVSCASSLRGLHQPTHRSRHRRTRENPFSSREVTAKSVRAQFSAAAQVSESLRGYHGAGGTHVHTRPVVLPIT